MKKLGAIILCAIVLIGCISGCGADSKPKIGVAFGVGPAARWPQEKQFMEEYAEKQNISLEARLNTDEKDLKALSQAALDQAVNLAQKKEMQTNTSTDNGSGTPVPSYLLTRQLVTKLNLDRVLIDSGHFTGQEVYGI